MIKKIASLFLVVMITIIILLSTVDSIPAVSMQKEDFSYQIINNEAVITNYSGKNNNVTVPSTLGGYIVSSIGKRAFNEQTKITKVTLPSTIKEIGNDAFFSCTRMQTINLPEGLEKIGDCAFYDCRSLKDITIPSSLLSLGDYAFGECMSLSNLEMKEGKYTKIPLLCFYYCSSLKEIKIPDNVTEIDNKAFLSCYELKNIYFPKHLKRIGAFAFFFIYDGQGNPPETPDRGTFNASVDVLDDYALFGSSFTDIDFSNILSVGKEAVSGMLVESIEIPEGLVNIKPGFLKGANEIKRITVDNNNENFYSLDGIMYKKVAEGEKTLFAFPAHKEVESYTVSNDVTEIADYAFSNCFIPEKMEIPSNIKKIGKGLFNNANFKTLSFNADVNTIYEDTFYNINCTEIILGDNIKQLASHSFHSANIQELCLPKHLETIEEEAFTFSTFKLSVDDNADNFCYENGAVYSKDKSELILLDSSADNTDVILSNKTKKIKSKAMINSNAKNIIINDGLEVIEDSAILLRNSSDAFNKIKVPSSVKSIGNTNFGYIFYCDESRYGQRYYQARAMTCFTIYGDIGSEAERYASKEHFAFFTSEPTQSINKVTLKKDENAIFTISNLGNIKAIYTSSDKDIATIDDNGKITGIAKGKTYVTAAVNCKYFVCEVNVTTGTYKNTDPYKDYLRVDYTTAEKFKEPYYKYNGYKEDGSDVSTLDFSSIYKYTGDDYHVYKAILLGDTDSQLIKCRYQNNIKQFYPFVDNCTVECDRMKTNCNFITYSGTNNVDEYTGTDSSLESMKKSIGRVITEPNITSTSIVHDVCTAFGGGPDRTLLEFCIPKNSNCGAYIEKVSKNVQEFEYFLPQNIKLKVVDAGVRAEEIEDSPSGTKHLEVERFLKVQVISDEPSPTEETKESRETVKPTEKKEETQIQPTENKKSTKNSSGVTSNSSTVKTGEMIISLLIILFVVLLSIAIYYYHRKRNKR